MNTSVPPTCESLLAGFPELFVQCIGDAKAPIRFVRAPEQGDAGSTIFCGNPRAVAQGLNGAAAILVIPRKSVPEVEPKRGTKTLLVSSNVELAMATIIQRFFLRTPYLDPSFPGHHPSAVVHPTAQLGADVRLGPHAVIGENVRLGRGVSIGANAVIEPNTKIDDETVIHALSFIGHGTTIGRRCEIQPNTVIAKEGFGYAHDEKGNHYRIPHQGSVVIEDDVHIGSCCALDRGTFGETRIGAGTKIDNQVHIGHNGKIGQNCLLTASFLMAGSSEIGSNCVTGGGTTVTGHIKIGDNIHLAGMSVVTKPMDKPGQYGGFPLQPLAKTLKTRAAIIHLPEMRKQIAMLMKKVFPDFQAASEDD